MHSAVSFAGLLPSPAKVAPLGDEMPDTVDPPPFMQALKHRHIAVVAIIFIYSPQDAQPLTASLVD